MINLEAEIAALRPSRSLLFCYTASLIHLETFLLDRLQQAGEGQVTLLVDRRAYEMTFAERMAVRAAGIDYHFAGVHLPGAAFHPKLYLCFSDAGATLFVASANLTLSGFRTNVEIVDRLHLSPAGQGDTAAFRALAGYLEGLPVLDAGLPDAVQDELRESAAQLRTWLADETDTGPRLMHSLERPLLEQLRTAVPPDEVREITVVSPFYDAAAEAIHQLVAAYPGATLNVLRRAESAHLSGRALGPLAGRVDVSDFRLRGKDADRPLHAKLLHLKGANRSWLVCGSANLSRPAWLQSALDGGNVEAVTLRDGDVAAFDALFDAVQPPQRLDLSALVWTYDADEREPAPPFRLVEARQDGGQFTVRMALADEAWRNAEFSLHLDPAHALPLVRGTDGGGFQERFARTDVDTLDEDRPLVVEVVGRLPDGRSARARGWLQRTRSLARSADDRAFRRSVRALEARGRLTDAGDLIVITDLLARLASRLGELHAAPARGGTAGSASGKPADEERPEHRIQGITIGEGGAALRGGPLSEPALLLDRIIESLQRAWRDEADIDVETRGLALSRGDAVDDAVEIGEEEARVAAPPLRASDIATLLARLESATRALFAGPPVPAAMPQVARLLVALAEFSFDMYLRLTEPDKAEQRARALALLDTLFERAFSTEGIGAGAPDGWLVRAWLSPEVRPSLREAWESTTLATAASVLLGANLTLKAGAQGRNRGLGRIAGLVLILGVERITSPEWASAMREFAAAMLSHRDPDPEAVVSAILEASIYELPCIAALTGAAPYLRRQGVAIPEARRVDAIPDYGRSWDRLASRFGGEVLVPPAFRVGSVACGRCFTALPAELANRVRHGNGHAPCAACGRVVLPVDFRNEHVLHALAELAGMRYKEAA